MTSAKRGRAKELGESLLRLAEREQEEAEPGRGEIKCPVCGAVVRETKNGRVRKHPSNPLRADEPCAASRKSLKALDV